MTADMATELKPYGVAVVSLYPGLVRTEKVMEAAKWLDLTNSESPDFIGRAVADLAADPEVLRYTGKVLVAASLAMEYGFTDVDGKTPPSSDTHRCLTRPNSKSGRSQFPTAARGRQFYPRSRLGTRARGGVVR